MNLNSLKHFNKVLILVLPLVLMTISSFSKPGITASVDRTSCYEGEELQFIVEVIDADANNVQIGDLKGFQLLSRYPVQTSSSEIIEVNGKLTQKTKNSVQYIHRIKALKKGVFTLPVATINWKGEVYTSNKVKVEVKSINSIVKQSNSDHFISVDVSNVSPYVGESFTISYTLFTIDEISSGNQLLTKKEFQDFGPFEMKSLQETMNGNRVTIKGKSYMKIQLQKHLLSPLKSGEISIPSFKYEFNGHEVVSRSFFGNRVKTHKRVVMAPKKLIKVKALPSPPNGFTGLVGEFSFSAEVDKKELKENEAIKLSYKLKGTGNFSKFKAFDLSWTKHWEAFEPKVESKVKASSEGYSGYKLVEIAAIARAGGDLNTPGGDYYFFNPKTAQYIKMQLPSFAVKAEGKPLVENEQEETGVTKKLVEENSKDNDALWPKLVSAFLFLFKSWWFYLLLLFGLGVKYVLPLFNKKEDEEAKRLRLQKAASKKAKRLLQEAVDQIQDEKAFYAALESVLNKFFMEKLCIQQEQINREELQLLLSDRLSAEEVEQVVDLFGYCQMAKYAPVQVEKGEVLEKAQQVLEKLV